MHDAEILYDHRAERDEALKLLRSDHRVQFAPFTVHEDEAVEVVPWCRKPPPPVLARIAAPESPATVRAERSGLPTLSSRLSVG